MQPSGDHNTQDSDAAARAVASPSTNPGFYVNGVRANTGPQNNRTLFRSLPDGVLGMMYMSLAFFLVAASDAQVKVLTEAFHPMQIAWTRQMGLLLGALVLLAMKGGQILRTSNIPLQVVDCAPLLHTFLDECRNYNQACNQQSNTDKCCSDTIAL